MTLMEQATIYSYQIEISNQDLILERQKKETNMQINFLPYEYLNYP